MSAGAASAIAALLYDPRQVSERALSRGFAVALAGWDVPSPRLTVAPLGGATPLCVAFYSSGSSAEDEDFEHVTALFEDELSPAVGVIDAAIEEGVTSPTVLTLVYSEDIVHDEAWRVTSDGFERRFVREGDQGIERGVETAEGADLGVIDESLEGPELERALRPHRGSTFLSHVIGAPVLATLMGALYAADRGVPVALVGADEASIEAETKRLNKVLGRVDGRGAPDATEARPTVAGAREPVTHAAFARTYDWADPRDPGDLYRGLALGAIVGNLRFLRARDLDALEWSQPAAEGLYPLARLGSSALGSSGGEVIVALARDGEALRVVRGAATTPAGPTFGELLRYLSLGWSRRGDAEEDLIGALMLRARVRAGR